MSSRKKWIGLALLTACAAGVGLWCAGVSSADAPSPTSAPDVAVEATVCPDARELLNQLRDAYRGLKTLGITGTMEAHFDVDGQKKDFGAEFKGSFQSGGLFQSEIKDAPLPGRAVSAPASDTVVGNTGQKIYVYLPGKNQYVMKDTPAGTVNLDSLGDMGDTLRDQDMSLVLALSGDAVRELSQNASTITLGTPVEIDKVSYPTIVLSAPAYDATLAIDPRSHLLRREVVDLTKRAKAEGAHDVKAATFALNFLNNPGMQMAAAQFAWAPPPGAQEMDAGGEASALVGKPAPPFSLVGMDGKTVTSDSLKGSVYVLDFWATWCPTCVESLPHLDEIYKQYKNKGVKFFALDQQEDKETVQKFIDDTKLTIPVLLDGDAKVGAIYDPDTKIPITVLVGKNGNILSAEHMVGRESELTKLIDAALKK